MFIVCECASVCFFVRFIPITSRKMIHGQSRMTLDFQTKQKWKWIKKSSHTHKCFDSKLFWYFDFSCTALLKTTLFWFLDPDFGVTHKRFCIHSTMRSIVLHFRVHWHIFINIRGANQIWSMYCMLTFIICFVATNSIEILRSRTRTRHKVVIWNL